MDYFVNTFLLMLIRNKLGAIPRFLEIQYILAISGVFNIN